MGEDQMPDVGGAGGAGAGGDHTRAAADGAKTGERSYESCFALVCVVWLIMGAIAAPSSTRPLVILYVGCILPVLLGTVLGVRMVWKGRRLAGAVCVLFFGGIGLALIVRGVMKLLGG